MTEEALMRPLQLTMPSRLRGLEKSEEEKACTFTSFTEGRTRGT